MADKKKSTKPSGAPKKTASKPITPKALAADRANLVKARAAEHQAHASGNQTSAQLAQETVSLAKARAERKFKHGIRGGSGKHNKLVTPLGAHKIAAVLRHKQSAPRKPSGINPRFKKRIAPTGYEVRGRWGVSRTHHMKKRIHARRPRQLRVKNFRVRRGRITPR